MNHLNPETLEPGAQKPSAVERQGVVSAPGATQRIDGAQGVTEPLESFTGIREYLEILRQVVCKIQALPGIDDDFNDGWNAGELHLIEVLLEAIPGNKPQ